MRRALGPALAACLALTGCAAIHVGAHEASPLAVVLFDVSRSTRTARASYEDAFVRVLDAVAREHGTIVGDVIDDNPLAHSTYPIDATFAGCSPFGDNRLVCDARTQDLRRRVLAQARAILDGPLGPPGTDIHDGLRLAERVFDAYPDAGARSLVVFSDMVERSAELSVVHASDPGRGPAALDALRAAGAVPDLSGVTVTVVGAGVGSGSELTADRIVAIERFWQDYFDLAGTTLAPDRYGAALIRFP
ncbi:MAG: hypothetical protein ACM3OO_01900 [Planctomycetaceae bacterium]